jgi:16S rRNA processing protein RimM
LGKNLIVIGRVSRPHGIKGEIRIEYFNPENPHFFSQYRMIYLQKEGEDPIPYRIIRARPHKKFILAELEGVQKRDDAEREKGKWVLVDPEELPALGVDEYYWYEILGIQVFTEQGAYIGEVKEIFPTGSNDVYVVKKGEKEFLIPAIKDVIIEIERDSRKMIIRPLEGLFEENDL